MALVVTQLREERAKKIHDARAIYKKAEDERRDPTSEENVQFDTLMKDAGELEARYLRIEKLEEAERSLGQSQGRKSEDGQPGGDEQRNQPVRATAEYRSAFGQYIRGGLSSLSGEQVRALSADNSVEGGFWALPQQMSSELIKAVDDMVFVRQHANVLPPLANAQSLGVPSLESDPDDADWTAEIDTGNEDSNMKGGKRELHPHACSKRIKVSQKLLRISSVNAEEMVRMRLQYKFGITGEKAYLTGDGAGKPLGIYVPSVNGISTSRDISTGNTATEIKADNLYHVKYSIKGQYWSRLRWNFHRDAMKQIALLKDSQNRYLWQESVRAGEPDTLLGFPVDMSEFAPNTFTTGLYVGALCDWKSYWIVDALTLTIQRLNELYAEKNQVGFIGRWESDGQPVLEEAFARVKLG